MTGRDFMMNSRDFHDDKWDVIMNSRDFHDDRSKCYYERSIKHYGVFWDDWADGGWFLLYWGLLPLCVGVAFESTCTVKGSEMSAGLFLYFKERYIKVCDFVALLAEHGSQFTVLLLWA